MRPLTLSARRSLFACLIALGAIAARPARADGPELAKALQPYVDQHKLAGAVVLVAGPEEILDVEAVGFSDVAARTPLKTDALFWIASMSKPMTATALMMLVDEGKVKLDDPVSKYLPEFRDQMLIAEKSGDRVVLKKPARPVLVRDVLSHTGGLVGRSPLESTLDSVSLREAAITYGLSPLVFEPGSKYQYSNPGINTAGRIIEVASGTPYETFMQTRLFDPLGMTDTTFWPDARQVERVAKSYKPNAKGDGLLETPVTQLRYPLTDRSRHPYPAGGLFSTAVDCAKFCQMILNGGVAHGKRLVSESSIRAMTSTQTGALLNGGKGEHGYGFGWSTSRMSHGDSGPTSPGPFGHGGAYSTQMDVDPVHKLITIYMVQHAGYPGVKPGEIHSAFRKAAEAAYRK